MRVYKVGLNNLDGLDVDYGMFTKRKALKYAKKKMSEIEKTYETEKNVINFDNFNITVTGYTLNKCDEFNVGSWILRENGKFTPETDKDRYDWLEHNANKLGYTLAE